jgi:hypothetical protein
LSLLQQTFLLDLQLGGNGLQTRKDSVESANVDTGVPLLAQTMQQNGQMQRTTMQQGFQEQIDVLQLGLQTFQQCSQ